MGCHQELTQEDLDHIITAMHTYFVEFRHVRSGFMIEQENIGFAIE